MSCAQEMCPNWSGDGQVCPCALFDIDPPCREMPTRTCPDGACGDRPCARFESDDEAPWLEVRRG